MPSFPTDITTATDVAEYIPAVWGERINNFLRSKLILASHFTNRSAELAGGGDTLYTPNMTEMVAASKTNGAAVTLNSPTETKVTLAVDKWFEVSFLIEDKELAQMKQSYYIQEKYATNAGFTTAKKLEVALATLFSGFATTVGTSTAAIVDSNIRAAIAAFEGANNQPEDGAFFFDTKVFWAQLQSIDRFALAINSPVQDPVAKRPKASLYGYPVWLSNNIQYVSGTTGRYNALASKDALHFATASLPSGSGKNSMVGSMGVRVQTNYIPEYLGHLTTADLVYGTIENRDLAGVAILTPAS